MAFPQHNPLKKKKKKKKITNCFAKRIDIAVIIPWKVALWNDQKRKRSILWRQYSIFADRCDVRSTSHVH